MTLAALRILAREKGIEIYKGSDQLVNNLLKRRMELIDELVN